jgi:plasmid stabilization system protein ParE
MEREPKSVKFSKIFRHDIIDVYKYGLKTFGKIQAEKYQNDIYRLVACLDSFYDIYPECRHLSTKSKMYRWIILESHLIIYRINDAEILILRVIHSHRSITKIKHSRSIKF